MIIGIENGSSAVSDILSKIAEIFPEEKKQYYKQRRLIFRGITKAYEPVDQIRSGLAVRLEKSHNEKQYSKADYISSLWELINTAKKKFPEKYKDATHLDILADLQHNGAATCLVDFSKNVLTALWFVCQGDFDDDGYLYCYNIMEDMIVNNTLTYIRPEDEKAKIDKILTHTYKFTNYCSDVINRFCLWEPSSFNNRIKRQDSIFLFGIEPFLIDNHDILVFKISKSIKKIVLQLLEYLFNISSMTIYNDPVGYASSNKKQISLYYNNFDSVAERSYQEGYNNMLKGCYETAIAFFKQYEGLQCCEIRDKIELYFSLAVCYKNRALGKEGEIRYYENAILDYYKVVRYSLEFLKKDKKSNQDDNVYYSRKCIRAYNEIIELLYKMKKYSQAIYVCKEVVKNIDSNCIFFENEEGENSFHTVYCKIAQIELYTLDNLVNNAIHKEIKKLEKQVNQDRHASYFDKILVKYYMLIYRIKTGEIKQDDYNKKIKEFRDSIFSNIDNKNRYGNYIDWNFADIKKAIEESEKKSMTMTNTLLEITAIMISGRDIFENQNWEKEKK